jgi:hypothetical protein
MKIVYIVREITNMQLFQFWIHTTTYQKHYRFKEWYKDFYIM